MEKGQTVYLKTQGNLVRASQNLKQEIIETTIKGVGTKYITVAHHDIKFYKEGLQEKTEYCSNYALYERKQDIYDEDEHQKLSSAIYWAFYRMAQNEYTLDQLREVVKILGLDE